MFANNVLPLLIIHSQPVNQQCRIDQLEGSMQHTATLFHNFLEKGLNYFIQGFVHNIKICLASNMRARAPSGTKVEPTVAISEKKRRFAQTA